VTGSISLKEAGSFLVALYALALGLLSLLGTALYVTFFLSIPILTYRVQIDRRICGCSIFAYTIPFDEAMDLLATGMVG
jgi:hypothetical protein